MGHDYQKMGVQGNVGIGLICNKIKKGKAIYALPVLAR
jgi:hypothetical protein